MSATDHLTADERGVILSCPRCARANRIPFPRIHETGRCGSCRASLPLPALPVTSGSTAVFSSLARNSSLPVFVDFWAPWCGPCKVVAPEVSHLAAQSAGELLVTKVNTQEQPEIASAMNIRSIPTFAVFVAGRELGRISGAMSAAELRAFVRRVLPDTKAS